MNEEEILNSVLEEYENSRKAALKENIDVDVEYVDSTQEYIREMVRIPLLTPEQEKALFIQYNKETDKEKKYEIKNKIVEANLRLVVSIAKKYISFGVPLSDLIQEGNIGLMNAVERFDLSKECKFCTYATYWIMQAVMRSINDKSKIVRLPVHSFETNLKLKKYIAEYSQSHGTEPTDEEIMKKLNITEECLKSLKFFGGNIGSLNIKLDPEKESTIENMVPSDYNLEDEVINELDKDYYLKLFDCLTDKEKVIVAVRTNFMYGYLLDLIKEFLPNLELDKDFYTLEDIGNNFKPVVTRERIRQIESKALKKMRIRIKKTQIDVDNNLSKFSNSKQHKIVVEKEEPKLKPMKEEEIKNNIKRIVFESDLDFDTFNFTGDEKEFLVLKYKGVDAVENTLLAKVLNKNLNTINGLEKKALSKIIKYCNSNNLIDNSTKKQKTKKMVKC